MGKGLFFGLLTIDIEFLSEKYIHENAKTKCKACEIYPGGPATNAAIAYSYLGKEAVLCSYSGQNSFNGFIHDDFTKHDVRFIDLIPETPRHPIYASIICSKENGSRTVYSYMPDTPIPTHSMPPDALKESKVLLLDGFYISDAIALAKQAKQNKIPVVFDGGSWKSGMDELLPYIDYALCSNDFIAPNCKSQAETVSLLHKHGIEKIAITNGEKPIITSVNGKTNEIPIEQCEPIIDTLGAGDFFHGAFCYYLSEGLDFETALLKASAVATKSCTSFGTRDWMQK